MCFNEQEESIQVKLKRAHIQCVLEIILITVYMIACNCICLYTVRTLV